MAFGGQEKSVVIMKPRVEDEIVQAAEVALEAEGLAVIIKIERFLADEEVDFVYEHRLEDDFYPEVKAYMLSGPCQIFLVQGPDARQRAQRVRDSVRGLYVEYEPCTENCIHASDPERAEYEVTMFSGDTLGLP